MTSPVRPQNRTTVGWPCDPLKIEQNKIRARNHIIDRETMQENNIITYTDLEELETLSPSPCSHIDFFHESSLIFY